MSLVQSASTVDDLLAASIQYLLDSGEWVETSRGRTLETRGARLELTNPRARVSRSGVERPRFGPRPRYSHTEHLEPRNGQLLPPPQ